jgi:transcription antitermination factor NusG
MMTGTQDEFLPADGISGADQCRWFAVQTRTRFEKKAASELREKHIETFLPLHAIKHKWSDRYRMVQLPLFPNYVFVRIGAAQETRVAVLRTTGVMKFVGGRQGGTPIPDAEIGALQTMLEQGVPFQVYSFLNVGQRVRIRSGCLDGIEGILTRINGADSLVISIQLVQRSVAVQVNGYQVEPLRSPSVNREARTVGMRREENFAMPHKEIPQLHQRSLVASRF